MRRAGGASVESKLFSESHPGLRKACLHFHYAFGFRTTLRLAHMLDSLVRVSRRVGRADDRFATDPELTAEFDHASHRAVGRHCKQSLPVVRSTNATDRRPTARGHPRPANESYLAKPITPTPKRRSPCSTVSDRPRAGRGAPPRESAPTANGSDRVGSSDGRPPRR